MSMGDYFTSHTIYCRKADINKALHPGVRVVEKAEVVNGEGRMWRVTFMTPTDEGFLKRMGVIKDQRGDVGEDGDADAPND